MPRNSALLAQIISTGMKAFITSKANDKSKKDAVKKGALRARAELQLSSRPLSSRDRVLYLFLCADDADWADGVLVGGGTTACPTSARSRGS